MEESTITIIETEPSPDWEAYYEEGLSKEDISTGEEVWKAGKEACSEMNLPEDLEIVSKSVHPIIENIFGKDWATFMKSTLLCMLIDFQDSHSDESDDEPQIFFPEDLFRIIYSLGKKIKEQDLTIESLKYALNKSERSVV